VAELGGDFGGLIGQAAVGETDDRVAGRLHLCVSGPVALECGPMAVEFEAIGLDHQLRVWPEGVDLAPENADVGLRRGEAIPLTQEYNSILQRGRGARWTGVVDQLAKGLEATAAVASRVDLLQGAHVEEIETFRLLEGACESLLVADFGNIEERSRNGGDRDFIDDRLLIPMYTAFVNDDALSGSAARRKNFRCAPLRQAPKRSRATVAEQRPLTTREHGGEPLASLVDPIPAQGVDPAMYSMQAARFNPTSDRARSQAVSENLSMTQHSVLPTGQRRERTLATRQSSST